MQHMSPTEIRAFLLEGTRTGKLATVRPNGRPHVVPIWFDLDGDTVVFTTWHTTVKAHNIRNNALVSLCVDEETPPYAYVMLEGTATLLDDLAQVQHWATRIGGRYMGSEHAEAFGRRNGVPGELLVRITPVHIVAHKNVAE